MYQLSIVRIIGKGFDDGEKYQGLDLRRLASAFKRPKLSNSLKVILAFYK